MDAMTVAATPPRRVSRLVAVDAARGAAIAGVVLYHFVWDLAFLGLTGPELASHPLWVAFGRTLAGSFLFLAGFSLVLANRKDIRWQKFGRRLSIIVAAALTITVVTWFAFPRAFVYFGILHMIAFGSVAGLLFLRAPPLLTVVAGCVVLTVPRLFNSAMFDPHWLAWIGFSDSTPPSNDFVPVFPWFGVFLIGIAAARATRPEQLAYWLAAGSGGVMVEGLAWLGRHSLSIYLVHQPLLLAILYPLV